MFRKRQIDAALDEIRAGQQRLLAAVERELRAAHARIEQLQGELADERRRVHELADQMAHLIDELGEARTLWHRAEEKLAQARGGEGKAG